MQRQTSRLTPGGPGHLQPVQDDDLRRLHLPPSIPVSRDGEEGAVVYNLRLQQSNVDARPECYQAPPNRTVEAGAGGGLGGAGGGPSPQHSTSTPSMKQPGALLLPAPAPPPLPPPLLTRRDVAASLAKFRSAVGSKPQKQLHSTRLGDEYHRQRAVEPATDYVSNSLLSSWRATSPDRLERSSNIIIPSGGLLSPPNLPEAAGGGGGAAGGRSSDEENASDKRPKQRSSSADSVRRLVARCSLLRFAKKHSAPKATTSKSQPTMTLVVNAQKAFDGQTEEEEDEEIQSPGGDDKDQEAPPWELPPNYVDMIFTKDPATIDNKKEKNVIKQQQQQQQQQQRQEQRQQRQTQHCCFNS